MLPEEVGRYFKPLSVFDLLLLIYRLESDVKKLKADLQSSRNTEQELRSQMNQYITGDKSLRSELYQLQQDNENLQNK